jgi:hypothetical protein
MLALIFRKVFRFRKVLFFIFLFPQNSFSQMIYSVTSLEEADVVVFVTDNEKDCDLKVFFVEEASQLGNPGVWAGTFELQEAQKKVYFTFEESEADLKIFVVEEESDAGWVKPEKRKLIEN